VTHVWQAQGEEARGLDRSCAAGMGGEARDSIGCLVQMMD
jgi:hypothetical protein